MARSLNDLKDILSAHGNLVVDASLWSATELRTLAELAKNKLVTLTLRNVDGKTIRELTSIVNGGFNSTTQVGAVHIVL